MPHVSFQFKPRRLLLRLILRSRQLCFAKAKLQLSALPCRSGEGVAEPIDLPIISNGVDLFRRNLERAVQGHPEDSKRPLHKEIYGDLIRPRQEAGTADGGGDANGAVDVGGGVQRRETGEDARARPEAGRLVAGGYDAGQRGGR